MRYSSRAMNRRRAMINNRNFHDAALGRCALFSFGHVASSAEDPFTVRLFPAFLRIARRIVFLLARAWIIACAIIRRNVTFRLAILPGHSSWPTTTDRGAVSRRAVNIRVLLEYPSVSDISRYFGKFPKFRVPGTRIINFLEHYSDTRVLEIKYRLLLD